MEAAELALFVEVIAGKVHELRISRDAIYIESGCIDPIEQARNN